MSPTVSNLLTNSQSIGKLLPDQKMAVYIWLVAQFSAVPSDWSNVRNWPNGLETVTPDQGLNMQIYALANSLGLPTDGAALAARVKQSFGAGPIQADLPTMLLNVVLKGFKAY